MIYLIFALTFIAGFSVGFYIMFCIATLKSDDLEDEVAELKSQLSQRDLL